VSKMRVLIAVFIFAVALNVVHWFSVREAQARWLNVPPVPSRNAALSMALGDAQLAYRINALMLQNLGDEGGRTTALKDYDYERLGQWFSLQDSLDERSNFIPFLAAYYYGAGQDASKFPPLIDYLAEVGRKPYPQKWRWLAQAVWLARFRMEDTDRALELAYDLSDIKQPNMPIWARQMPAFIHAARGEKEAAYDMMLGVLRSGIESGDMHPNEINFMRDFICTRLLDMMQARKNPLCEK